MLQNYNLRVLTIVTDNNIVNRVLFKILTEQSQSNYFEIPYSLIRAYVTDDSVHVLKNIRSNRLNLKTMTKHFIYLPLMEDENNIVKEVKFQDIVALYKKKCNMLIRSAPKLSAKTISLLILNVRSCLWY